MRRAMKTLVLVAAVAMVGVPAKARAEGYVNPWAGIIFGSSSESTLTKNGFKSFGASIGDTGNKSGIDVNFGYSKDFFGSGTNVLDLMAGITAGPQLGRSVRQVRPTIVGGVGLLRSSAGGQAANDFGFNIGGGVFAFFSTHLGLRGDVRYYRTLNGAKLGAFHFTRGQIGLLIR